MGSPYVLYVKFWWILKFGGCNIDCQTAKFNSSPNFRLCNSTRTLFRCRVCSSILLILNAACIVLYCACTPVHSLPCVHVQGVKQLVCLIVVIIVVIGTKIARSHVLGICACCKYNPSVDVDKKLELLKKAY